MQDHSRNSGCRIISYYSLDPVTGICLINASRINAGYLQRCHDPVDAVCLVRPDIGNDALRVVGIGYVEHISVTPAPADNVGIWPTRRCSQSVRRQHDG